VDLLVRKRPAARVDALTFGCVPHTDDEHTRMHLHVLCAWLSSELGIHVRPHRAPSPDALASAFGAGRVDIAWVSPALLITAPQLEDASPVVCSIRQGLASYHAVLFVEERSRYKSLMYLPGARAAWVARSSAAGYIVPRMALATHGLDPRSMFDSETFYDSHGNVGRAVLGGEADVGATYAVFEGGIATGRLVRAGFDEAATGRAARILHAAGPIPSDPIVVGSNVSAMARATLVRALTQGRMDPTAREALDHVLGAEAFATVDRRAFDALREDILHARTLGLLSP
jgi:phosphonate transport system substrate-binding protein